MPRIKVKKLESPNRLGMDMRRVGKSQYGTLYLRESPFKEYGLIVQTAKGDSQAIWWDDKSDMKKTLKKILKQL